MSPNDRDYYVLLTKPFVGNLPKSSKNLGFLTRQVFAGGFSFGGTFIQDLACSLAIEHGGSERPIHERHKKK